MSPQSWCIFAVFLIISQQISSNFGTTKRSPGTKNGTNFCNQRGKFFAEKFVVNLLNQKLQNFMVDCTTITIFEVRYTNGQLCKCNETHQKRFFYSCEAKLSSNFSVVVSLSNQTNETCNFFFTFGNHAHSFSMRIAEIPKKTTTFVGTQKEFRKFTKPITEKISSAPATPSLATKQVLMTSLQKKTIAPNSSSFIQPTSIKISEVLPGSTLSPEEKEMKKLKQDIEFIKNLNTSTVKIGDTNIINQVLDAAANLINTNLTTDYKKDDPGMRAVEVLQDLGNSISQQLYLGNNKSVTFEKVTADLVFGAAVVNATISPGFIFPTDDIKMTGSEKINIPSSVFVSDKSYFVGIIFKAYREMRNNTGGLSMGTKVINAVVSPRPSDELEDPVEMTFKKNIIGQTSAQQCSFWIENATLSGEHGRWSTRQCFKTFENESHVKCGCRHFTNFAVLFKISDEEQHLHEEHSFRLVIITYFGLSLSILGCLLTFIIYVALPNIKSERATIHKNLVFALGIADVIFLVTVGLKPDGDSCIAVTMLTFFFYLAVFFWMLVEGVYIYLMVIKVFRGNVRKRRKVAYILGWGCPVIISLVTWAILRHDVVSKYHCWLSVKTGAIWAFVGPGLAIILTNCIILVAAMRTTWATFVDNKEYGGLKSATKTFGAVIPILGITWIFGVMAFNDSSIVFQYIFAIVNSAQGALIFILYCVVNNEVRNEINRRIIVWQTRREMSSSSGAGGQRATKPCLILSEKNTIFDGTAASALENKDPLSELGNDPVPSEKEEEEYLFKKPDKTFENYLKFGVKEDKDGGCQEKE